MKRATAMITAMAAMFAMASTSASAAILPIGIWHFNASSGTEVADASGHHHTGTLEGGAAWSAGRFQGAVSLNGQSAAVKIPASSTLEPSNITVSTWLDATNPGSFRYVLAKGANGCIAASYALYTGPNGGLEFYVAGSQGASYGVSPEAGTGIWNGQWHNVVGTYDGSTVRLYLDGQQVGSGTAYGTPIGYPAVSSNDLLIGNFPGCAELGFRGRVDEVKLFDRAMSTTEIKLGVGLSRLLPSFSPFDVVL
jgi:hypothetical protein